jgi:RNA polymerase sigma-70 factor (ECF subfamily)
MALPSREVEQRLLRRARRGDAAATETLIGLFQGPLQGFLLRLCGSRELAEDLAQETFVRVLGNLDRFDDRFRFSTWLYTIARRLWMNHINKHRPVPDSEHVESRGGTQELPVAMASRHEQRTRLRRLLDRALTVLSAPQREMVLLFHQQGWGVGEIARQANLPEGTVKSHLFRARRRMLEEISRDAAEVAFAEEVLR